MSFDRTPTNTAARQNNEEFPWLPHDVGLLLQSGLYSFQQACNGVIQDVNKIPLMPHIDEMSGVKAPTAAPIGTRDWLVENAGGGLGSVLPFIFASKLAEAGMRGPATRLFGEGAARVMEQEGFRSWAIKGATYEGLFHPVDANQPFWSQKFQNIGAGALSFGMFGAVTNKLSQMEPFNGFITKGSPLRVRLFAGAAVDTIGGATAGITDATTRALMSGHGPSMNDISSEALQYGVIAGGAHFMVGVGMREDPYTRIARNRELQAILRGHDGRPADPFVNQWNATKNGISEILLKYAAGKTSGNPNASLGSLQDLFLKDPGAFNAVGALKDANGSVGGIFQSKDPLKTPGFTNQDFTLSRTDFDQAYKKLGNLSLEDLRNMGMADVPGGADVPTNSSIVLDGHGGMFVAHEMADGTVRLLGVPGTVFVEVGKAAQSPWAPSQQQGDQNQQQNPQPYPYAPIPNPYIIQR